MAPHEALKNKIPRLHFRPEGYVSSSDAEYLDQLLEMLRAKGFDPDQLVFSGFDGTKVAQGEPVPRFTAIFVMNEAGWREALKYHDESEANPAEYPEREDYEVPCIGLYDRTRLVHVYDADISAKDENTRAELTNITLGEPLTNYPPSQPHGEAVVHVGYPDASPTDALVGLVFLEEPKRERGKPGF